VLSRSATAAAYHPLKNPKFEKSIGHWNLALSSLMLVRFEAGAGAIEQASYDTGF
jgi:hypothetical protein